MKSRFLSPPTTETAWSLCSTPLSFVGKGLCLSRQFFAVCSSALAVRERTDSSHVCSLSSVFSDAHVIGENVLYYFRRCASKLYEVIESLCSTPF